MGYELNKEFIQKPHHWDPRRLYSQTGADWQYRVDFDRLRKERLQRTREQMEKHDLGALVLFAGANIRYVTGSYQGNWKYNINIRYVVLPRGGEPVLFETAGSDLHCAIIDLPWIAGNIRPAITWQWAEGAVPFMAERMVEGVMEVLKENKVQKEKIGIDNLDMPAFQALKDAGLNIVNGWPAMSAPAWSRRSTRSNCSSMSSTIGDAAMWKIKYEWLKPGVTSARSKPRSTSSCSSEAASSSTTSSWPRAETRARTGGGRPNKMIRQGDLVIVDINAVGPSGYFIDFVRLFKCARRR